MAKGYAQEHGVCRGVCSVARWDTIRCILATATHNEWCVYQLDVKSAFLYGELEEVVHVEQPKGYERKGHENKMYKIKELPI